MSDSTATRPGKARANTAASSGFVVSWTYDFEDYSRQMEVFRRGKRKRPPKPNQMWFATLEAAEKTRAEFTAAHPRGGISIEAGPKPKRTSMMVLGATATSIRSTMLFEETGQ